MENSALYRCGYCGLGSLQIVYYFDPSNLTLCCNCYTIKLNEKIRKTITEFPTFDSLEDNK